MTDRIAISDRKVCQYMFEANLTHEQVKRGLETIKQPCKGLGYYYPDDVLSYIRGINPNYSQLPL
jgi:hypothetical protein